jgi:hypothetical protein
VAKRGGLVWVYDTLRPGLARLFPALEISIEERLENVAQEIEDYMKANAPWEDQTGEARDGLRAELTDEGKGRSIILYHTVEYGIWLEVRWSGRYAIIQPTIEVMGPAVMVALHGSMEDAV